MICFEVWANGEKLCVAGIGESGVMSAILTWSQKTPGKRAVDGSELHPFNPHLHVGGLSNGEHVRWLESLHELEIGDEVVVKIIESDTADEPIHKYPKASAESEIKQRYQQFKLLQREFEGVEDEADLESEEAMHLKAHLILEYKNEFEAWKQSREHD